MRELRAITKEGNNLTRVACQNYLLSINLDSLQILSIINTFLLLIASARR
jgi:hypothetical protein